MPILFPAHFGFSFLPNPLSLSFGEAAPIGFPVSGRHNVFVSVFHSQGLQSIPYQLPDTVDLRLISHLPLVGAAASAIEKPFRAACDGAVAAEQTQKTVPTALTSFGPDHVGGGQFAQHRLAGQLVPERARLPVVHQLVAAIEKARTNRRCTSGRRTPRPSIGDPRAAQRAVSQRDRHAADDVVGHLVPVEDAQRISPRFAVERQSRRRRRRVRGSRPRRPSASPGCPAPGCRRRAHRPTESLPAGCAREIVLQEVGKARVNRAPAVAPSSQ